MKRERMYTATDILKIIFAGLAAAYLATSVIYMGLVIAGVIR